MWCWDYDIYTGGPKDGQLYPSGRPYLFADFVTFAVQLIDLLEAIQATPCVHRGDKLRATLLAAPEAPPLIWYKETFLPMAADYASCGYGEPASEDLAQVPQDIANRWDELLARQLWRLTSHYMRGATKRREFTRAESEDFDVGLYVPFWDDVYQHGEAEFDAWLLKDGGLGFIRAGSPFWQGPATWFLWHHAAARIKEMEELPGCGGASLVAPLLLAFKNLLAAYAPVHPCPYCREHFQSRVSRNDRDWQTVVAPIYGGESPFNGNYNTSETPLYPLEYLFLSHDADSISTKLDTVESSDDLMLFLWKIHNAVQSSVKYNTACRREETFDEALFACESPPAGFFPDGGYSPRRWPFSRRFEFTLQTPGLWEKLRKDEAIRSAIGALDELDNASVRADYWTAAAIPTRDEAHGKAVVAAAKTLSDAVLATGVLRLEFEMLVEPTCDRALAEISEPPTPPPPPPPPLKADGQFPSLDEWPCCFVQVKNSSAGCDPNEPPASKPSKSTLSLDDFWDRFGGREPGGCDVQAERPMMRKFRRFG